MNVLMLGPGLGVQGGISAVERMTLAALPRRISATHVATMEEGSKARKLVAYLRALARTFSARRPDVVHIPFASRASSVRKISLARLAGTLGAMGNGRRSASSGQSPTSAGARPKRFSNRAMPC